jgi:hypothetical protein
MALITRGKQSGSKEMIFLMQGSGASLKIIVLI